MCDIRLYKAGASYGEVPRKTIVYSITCCSFFEVKNFDTNLCIVEKTESFCPSVITRLLKKSKIVS